MAEHGAVEIGTATGVNYADHRRTYEGFINLAKYGTLAVVILLVLMAFFLL
ncbi:MAG: aa3-type cytochrome c oxidase subunit IV [Bauldia sp.]|nr:MAG: aa3-type cytochrome c oxidase subunit IV [Bauldia sp.]MBZ0227679.1 aa3-type cytochrome c oxidase subunit IV [Bauldia sp.]